MFVNAPQKRNQFKGFTLIELLLVVVLISILTGVVLSVLNVGGLRSKARDSQRKSDLARIQAALELYFTDNRSYPISVSWINVNSATNALRSALVTSYLDVLPQDTKYNNAIAPEDPCAIASGGAVVAYRYNYRTNTAGSFYILTAIMEVTSSNDGSSCTSATPVDLTNCGLSTCGAAGNVSCCCALATYTILNDICYGVQNPF